MARLSLLETALETFRALMTAREHNLMIDLSNKFVAVEASLEADMIALAEKCAARGYASPNQIRRLGEYKRLMKQASEQAVKYSNYAAETVTAEQVVSIQNGVQSARASIIATYRDSGIVSARFDFLAVEAIDYAVGFAMDGTPLNNLIMRDFAESGRAMLDTLIVNTAKGTNPRDTARLMTRDFAINHKRALVIARTETMRPYREANRQQMAASGVVTGYIRRCALNTVTCAACLGLDGKRYPTDEVMHVHPNDRCFHQPVIVGLPVIEVRGAKQWFDAQDEQTQKKILGKAKFKAYQEGQIDLPDIPREFKHDTWGNSVRIATLSELGIKSNGEN